MMNILALKAGLRAACVLTLATSGAAWSQPAMPTSPMAAALPSSGAGVSGRAASGVSSSSAPAGTSPSTSASTEASTEANTPTDAANCPPTARPLTSGEVRAGLQQATDHGFLWRITKAGHTSYLYGTIHAARADWVFPGPSVREAVETSDVIALELDVLDLDIKKRLADAAKATPGDALPAPLATRLRARVAAECLDADALAGISPVMQVAYLTVLSGRRNGIDPAFAIETYLSALSRQLKKPIQSLETPESQLKVLNMGSAAERQAFVTTGLTDLESGVAGPILTRIANVWALSDWKSLSSYKEWCQCERTPAERAFMKRLLDDRNAPLAASIDALHSSGKRVFAAVGVLHMTGPNGLPARLKKRGYKIEEGDFTR